jgi:hypothetical protein
MRFGKILVAGALVLGGASAASANGIVSLNFENINSSYPSGFAQILDFYNGGVSSDGTSGTNYGISFGRNALAICLNSTSVTCSNTSRGGLAPGSDRGGLFFLEGDETFMNIDAGFTTGFSFNYVSLNFQGSVSVFDGLNGSGNLLATLNLSPNAGSCPGYNAGFCPFSPVGVLFDGTARSVSFAGVANQIVFDDITFGSDTPGGVIPEPATWAMMIAGFGLVGAAMRRRRTGGRVVFD